jgi:hypothetical protein
MRYGVILGAVCLGLLVYSGRITVPFIGNSPAASLKRSLNAEMKEHGDDRRAKSANCSRSHALDSLKGRDFGAHGVQFKGAWSCDVTWSDGTTAEFCQLKWSKNPGFGRISASCEAAARGGYGRSLTN